MKKIAGYLFFTAILASLTTHIGCNGGNEKPDLTEQQEQAKLIEGTWTVSTVDSKPTDVPESEVSDMSFTFGIDEDYNPTTFSVTGSSAANFFATSALSTWSFAGGNVTNIQLTGVTPVSAIVIQGTVSATTMTISFTLSTARVANLNGNYILTLTK